MHHFTLNNTSEKQRGCLETNGTAFPELFLPKFRLLAFEPSSLSMLFKFLNSKIGNYSASFTDPFFQGQKELFK